MKVLFLLHTSRMDGSTISFLNLMVGLINKGVTVAVAGPKLQARLCEVLKNIGVCYFEVSIAESVYPSLSTLYPLRVLNLIRRKYKSYCELRRVVNAINPDIIHTNTGILREGFKVARDLGIYHVWHVREYQDKDFSWHFFPTKRSYVSKLHKSYVITITDDIKRYFNLSDYKRALTIYNGVCYAHNTCQVSRKDKYFLCASRIGKEKGFDDVIAAFSLFHKKYPDYRLIILGDGQGLYVDQLKRTAHKEGCLEAIDWLGYKSDVLPFMQKATALIVASFFEGFGRMTVEACFAGCLVVGRNSGGTKEILSKTGGFFFDDNQSFFQALCDVVSLSTDEYNERALFAQQKARQLYSIEGNVDRVYRFYKDILSDDQKS